MYLAVSILFGHSRSCPINASRYVAAPASSLFPVLYSSCHLQGGGGGGGAGGLQQTSLWQSRGKQNYNCNFSQTEASVRSALSSIY